MSLVNIFRISKALSGKRLLRRPDRKALPTPRDGRCRLVSSKRKSNTESVENGDDDRILKCIVLPLVPRAALTEASCVAPIIVWRTFRQLKSSSVELTQVLFVTAFVGIHLD